MLYNIIVYNMMQISQQLMFVFKLQLCFAPVTITMMITIITTLIKIKIGKKVNSVEFDAARGRRLL